MVRRVIHRAGTQADDRDFSGTVTKIFDGDSFLVRPAGGQRRRRPPDSTSMPLRRTRRTQTTRALLSLKLIGSRRVFVDVIDIDQATAARWRACIASPIASTSRRSLVHDGHVWVYRRTAARPLADTSSRMKRSPRARDCGRCRRASACRPGSIGICNARSRRRRAAKDRKKERLRRARKSGDRVDASPVRFVTYSSLCGLCGHLYPLQNVLSPVASIRR